MKRLFPIILLFFSLSFNAFGQTDDRENQQKYAVKIKKATSKIVLDGQLNEADWTSADVATDFWQKNPKDNVKAVLRTEMRLTYDDDFLYVSATCFDTPNHIISTLKRDVGFWDGDNVGVVLDPLNEASSGFLFGTNPYGVQTDVACGGGTGRENYSGEWDNRWYVETQLSPDRWTVEMAIPFKTIRYKVGKTTWGINFFRNDKKNNRQDVWAQVPRQFWFIDMGYTGRLEWDASPKKTNGNISVIPYINTNSYKDFEEGTPTDYNFDVGVDAKIALSPSLNLDLTVNPDFSQVEVDKQVTNLTRFSIFLPERRTFFIENSDMFSNFGIPIARPFFSRRIGLDGDGQAVPISYGARITGNITSSTRIGLMNVQTKGTADQLAQNYSTAVFNQRVFGRSQIKGIFVNRQAMTEGEFSETDYGRNAGLEYNYQSNDGKWNGWGGYQHSFSKEFKKDNYFTSFGGEYAGTILNAVFDWSQVGTNYFADVGFVNRVNNYDAVRDTTIRLGYNVLYAPVNFQFVPENSTYLNRHSISTESFWTFDPDFKFVERSIFVGYRQEYKNGSSFRVGFENNETDLRFPFSFTDGEPLPKGRYQHNRVGFNYQSDERKLFQFEVEANTGGFYNGTLNQVSTEFGYRTQPWGVFGLEVEYNQLSFPDEYGETTIWAFSPKVEISFNRNLFLTTFLQYNTQADNFNINTRFQWRFAPMSDVFLVYTDNYMVETFGPKNRSLVLKVNYWLVI